MRITFSVFESCATAYFHSMEEFGNVGMKIIEGTKNLNKN
jgi:hypothetical protein